MDSHDPHVETEAKILEYSDHPDRRHATVANPIFSTNDNNFSDAPDRRFSPRPH
jgi:hypothetical protein